MKRILNLTAILLCLVSQPAIAAGDKPLVMESAKIKQLPAATTLQINASGTGAASINIPHGTAPTSPVDGDCWTTTAGLYCRINGATVAMGSGGVSAANPTATASDAAVNGTATTYMRSDAAPAIQKASSSVFGLAKVDGTTITATGGVISATGGGGVTYSNGSFTPSIAFGGATTGITYTNQNGFYIKLNKLACVQIFITLNSKGTATGNLTVTGLPFTTDATTNNEAAFTFSLFTITNPTAWADPNTTVVKVFKNTSGVFATNADVINGQQFILGGCYETT